MRARWHGIGLLWSASSVKGVEAWQVMIGVLGDGLTVVTGGKANDKNERYVRLGRPSVCIWSERGAQRCPLSHIRNRGAAEKNKSADA